MRAAASRPRGGSPRHLQRGCWALSWVPQASVHHCLHSTCEATRRQYAAAHSLACNMPVRTAARSWSWVAHNDTNPACTHHSMRMSMPCAHARKPASCESPAGADDQRLASRLSESTVLPAIRMSWSNRLTRALLSGAIVRTSCDSGGRRCWPLLMCCPANQRYSILNMLPNDR